MTTQNILPIIQTAHALTSLRESGFSFPAAISELIDNSIEAGSSRINCNFYQDVNGEIEEIATSDNGCGMSTDVLHGYPVVGRSTRYGSTEGIGKFGMGAKLGALNFCKKFGVYSRTDTSAPFKYVEFDLEEAMQLEQDGRGNEIGVQAPVVVTSIPEKFYDVVDEDTKTLVVWTKIDKLQAGKRSDNANALNDNLKEELSRIFRYFLFNGIEININGNSIGYFDPTMQLPASIQDAILTQYYHPESSTTKHFAPTVIAKDIDICRVGDEVATLTVVLYPNEIVRKSGMGGDNLAKALRVPHNQGRLSFVRNGREISYTQVPQIFGRGVLSTDRFIGIEVRFTPIFDQFFGVRHVKRGIEPYDIVRKEIREHLKTILPIASKAIQAQWNNEEQDIDFEKIEKAVARANALMLQVESEVQSLSDDQKASQRQALVDLAKEIGIEDFDSFAEKKMGKPYIIEVIDSAHNDFLDFKFLEHQVHIGINKNHLMYKNVWSPLYEISKQNASSVELMNPVDTANCALNALNIMLVCLAKTNTHTKGESVDFGEFVSNWGVNMDRFLREVK
ncbi:ATP-binding protein [Photobacterium damselae]|uniref:ATP-binding protein n=1 Tax=Photobacterium damselae TaxID=38293 RepID=UPI001F177605|nr:ATP-binding protein [Photobacterium damselae]UKA05003.1 ATP-binding protein [Photobacterium damselae subsp. damselae]